MNRVFAGLISGAATGWTVGCIVVYIRLKRMVEVIEDAADELAEEGGIFGELIGAMADGFAEGARDAIGPIDIAFDPEATKFLAIGAAVGAIAGAIVQSKP